MLLSVKYHLPESYTMEIKNIFDTNNINKIFNQFLERNDILYKNNSITRETCDYYFDDKKS